MRKINTVGIVSLSSGMLGEDFARAQRELGVKRLEAYGLRVKFMPNALRGIAALNAHPEARAADLIAAFQDPEVDLIMTAIGGDDTYRLLPYLFGHDELKNAVTQKPFLGFSDTTVNHLMLHKLGLKSFYGQAFLTEICEPGPEMLPYSRQCFEEFIETGRIAEVRPSPLWYEERPSFGPEQMGVAPVAHENGGFELLQGPPVFRGKILGGCICTLFDLFDGGRYPDSPALAAQYGLFPPAEDWQGRILLLESSEERPAPGKYRAALTHLKNAGVLDAVSGLLIGKPQNEVYDREYREILREVVDDPTKPIVCNLPIGHALPRCILPFGVEAEVDAEQQRIRFFYM
ncbi:MAG: LD-carboxypeptidase [Oscillospiraceae bacterium]|nr:LD-carboxypeptidase [Oscillospiraceae bacterium]